MSDKSHHLSNWWESATVGDVTLGCTPAQHSSARTPFDQRKSLWCGWTMRGNDACVYFAGDSAYFPGFANIGEKYGPFDAVLLPIGSYMPRSDLLALHLKSSFPRSRE